MINIKSIWDRAKAAHLQHQREHLEQRQNSEHTEHLELVEMTKQIERVEEVAAVEQRRCNALAASPFRKLPGELVLRIAFFLKPETQAALSLCCKPILSKLGSLHLKSLNKYDRYEFLAALERDLPQYIVCYPCKKLHSIKKVHDYDWIFPSNHSLNWEERQCYGSDTTHQVGRYIHDRFSYPLFRMTMELYRQGKDHSELLEILSCWTQTWSYHEVSLQRCWLARIVNGSLVIREQTTVLFPPPDRQRFDIYRALEDVRICIHRKRVYKTDFDDNWDALPRAGWKQLENNGYRLMVNSCGECNTEFRTDFESWGDHGDALFVTRWMDLGEGRSHIDDTWQSHISVPGYSPEMSMGSAYEIGTIAAAFERGMSRFEFDSHFNFDAISTAKEREELINQRFP
jgi:hypothetical protein